MINLKRIVGVILLLGILLPSGVIALTDTFQQYNPDYPLSAEWSRYEISNAWNSHWGSYPQAYVNWPYADTQIIRPGFSWGNHAFDHSEITYSTTRCPSTYAAFTMCAQSNDGCDAYINFYKENVGKGSARLTNGYTRGFSNWDRYELFRDGNDVNLYCSGILIGDVGSMTDRFDTIGILVTASYKNRAIYLYMDDYVQGCAQPNVISTIPTGGYILNYPSDPGANGLYGYNGMMIYGDVFHTTWATTKDIYPINQGDLRIDTICLSTAETVNTTYLDTTKSQIIDGDPTVINNQAGCIEYNLNTLLINPGYPYGQYVQQLTKGEEVLDADYFWYLGGGSNLEFSQDSYVIGETLSLNYSINDFNDEEYNYYIKIIDLYGQEYDSKKLNLGEAHVTFTTNSNTYPSGQYFAVIEALPEGETKPITIAFDTTSLDKVIRLEGVAYDAVNEEILEGVQVSCLQGSGYFNDTSTSSGYGVNNLVLGSIITINATKEGYSFTPITFTPLDTGIFTVNIYMIPDDVSYEGSAIQGLCYLYPYHLGLNSSSVSIQGEGLSHTEISNSLGYYLINLSSSIENEIQPVPNTTIVNQNISCGAFDTWYPLNYPHIKNLLVSNVSDFSYLYEDTTDYSINSTDGKIKLLENSSMAINTDYYTRYEKGTSFILNQTHLVPYSETISSANGSVSYTLEDYEINYTTGSFLAYPEGNISDNISIDYDYAYFGDVTLSATSTGYTPAENVSLKVTAGDIIQQNFEFSGSYNLNIEIRDFGGGNLIFDEVHIECSDGQVLNTTTGKSVFCLDYGMYTLSASASDYLTSSYNVLVDKDRDQIIYLKKDNTNSGGTGVNYPPHSVRFIVRNIYGSPQAGITIEAEYSESSGPLEWLTGLLGYNEDAGITNATLSGSTGIDGSITFTMVETIKYKVTMTEEGSSSPFLTFGLYPKQDEYSFTLVNPLSGIGGKDLYKDVNWTLGSEMSEDYLNVSLQFYYNDTLENTEEIEFYVLNATSREKLYSEIAIDQNIMNCSYSVNNTKGDQYIWGFNATHIDFGDFGKANVITLQGPTGRLIDLGLYGEDEGWYNWISAALIILLAGSFGARRSRYGLVAVPIWADMLFFIGWMPAVSILIMITATAAGIISYISLGEGKII